MGAVPVRCWRAISVLDLRDFRDIIGRISVSGSQVYEVATII